MEKKRGGRRDVVMTDLEALIPQDHLLRKIEKIMDYDWLYERLSPYYCEDNGRPGIKMELLEHLYGIGSLRQTHREIEVNVAYQWFLGYNQLEKIPHMTPWIIKKILDDNRIPIVPYTRYKGKKDTYKPWNFVYDAEQDCFICPQGCQLRHTTTDKNGKRFYRSTPKDCRNCPCREQCGANAKGQRLLTTHIWQEYL